MVAVAVVLCGAAAVMQFLDYGVWSLRLQWLDSNVHDSVPGFASLAVLAVAAGAALVVARRRASRRLLVLSAALAGTLALRLAEPAHVLELSLPLVALAFALLWFLEAADAHTLQLSRLACVSLAVSFVVHLAGMRLLSAIGHPGTSSWAYQIKVVVKHDAELAGWVLAAAALLRLARHSVAARRLRRPIGLQLPDASS